MYNAIWNAAAKRLSGDRMRQEVAELFELSRLCCFDRLNELARLIVCKLAEAGASDARLIEFPADGRTFYGGWSMPLAYDVESASLVDADSGEALANYAVNPTSLMLYSTPTPAGEITAELVVADSLGEITAERVRGRFVITNGIGVAYGLAAAKAGAAGLVNDCRASARFIKDGPYLDSTNEWHNYTIPPWDEPGKGFGFSISPDQGKRLRGRLAGGETIRLHAEVATRHYVGVLPVISARIPGELPEEIALTGHFDEFGADDNCSQVAVAIEVVRAITGLIRDGEIPPLRRSIRILLPMEVRGLNALVEQENEVRGIRCGLNIDTVGTDQNATTSACTLTESFAANPSFAEELAEELLSRVQDENPLFRWRRSPADTIDNILGEPLIGAPTPAIYHFSGMHHVALDTPDRISPQMLFDMARVTATYAAYLAGGGLDEALWLAELCADHGERRLGELAGSALRGGSSALLDSARALHLDYSARIRSARWLVPNVDRFPSMPGDSGLASVLVGEERVFPRELYNLRCELLTERLNRALADAESRTKERTASDAATLAAGPLQPSRLVPVKAFRGFLAFEDLDEAGRQRLAELGIEMSWAAPMWLQNALFFANGKRTVDEIARLIRERGDRPLETAYLERVFGFLAERGLARFRPYLSSAEIRTALERAGIRPGDAVVGHFSLSRLGYVEGGADGLIDLMFDLLGPQGTLMMPAFTCSFLGTRPFDRELSPSGMGVVTERFRKRPGVLRSAHPSHSFTAFGPLAERLLAGHDHTQSPVSPDGPMGRLAVAGGKVLLFGCPDSNTSMHVGELAGGIPLPDFVCRIVDDGAVREVVVPSCPWHVRFDAAWERLYDHRLAQEVALGEGSIRLLHCRDSIDANTEVARKTPEALVEPDCDCPYCRGVREHCRHRGC